MFSSHYLLFTHERSVSVYWLPRTHTYRHKLRCKSTPKNVPMSQFSQQSDRQIFQDRADGRKSHIVHAIRVASYRSDAKNTHMLLTISYSESAYLITPGQPLKPRFNENVIICLLFGHKQQQKLIICCWWQYHIRNQRSRWEHVSTIILEFQHILFTVYSYEQN